MSYTKLWSQTAIKTSRTSVFKIQEDYDKHGIFEYEVVKSFPLHRAATQEESEKLRKGKYAYKNREKQKR